MAAFRAEHFAVANNFVSVPLNSHHNEENFDINT